MLHTAGISSTSTQVRIETKLGSRDCISSEVIFMNRTFTSNKVSSNKRMNEVCQTRDRSDIEVLTSKMNAYLRFQLGIYQPSTAHILQLDFNRFPHL